jgi:two-component system C4-dicarboxylate transport response regulator DctD
MSGTVLLVEDDEALRASLAQALDLEGLDVIQTAQFAQVRRVLRANFNGVVLTDIRMPGQDGFEVLRLARSIDPEIPVVMLTGAGDVPMAIRAMKEGAHDFLEKPCSTDHLVEVLNRALEHRALVLRNRAMERRLRRSDLASVNFPGRGAASTRLREQLRAAAESGAHVVLVGPAGAGKRLASHTLFHLMGVQGRFEAQSLPLAATFRPQPETAVLTLKGLGRADAATWAAVRAALEERPTLRLIGITRGPVPAEMAALAPVVVEVPDLAARHEDLPAIFEEVLRQAARNADRDMPPVSREVIDRIMARPWPGNLAELRAFANAYLNGQAPGDGRPMTLAERMEAFERSVLEATLRRHGGKASAAAAELGLPRKTFYDRLARYALRPRDFAAGETARASAPDAPAEEAMRR